MKKCKNVIIYGIILYISWSIIGLGIIQFINLDKNVVEMLKELIFKTLIWTIPAIILIKKNNDNLYLKSTEIYNCKCNWVRYIAIIVLMLAICVVITYLTNGKVLLNRSFGITIIIFEAVLPGISEELVFRGLFLNSALNNKRQWLALVINSLLFLIIHFPGWIESGIFMECITSGGVITVFLLGLVFGLSFIKSKSIWVPIVLHISWNIFASMFA